MLGPVRHTRRASASTPIRVLAVDHTAGLAGGEVALSRLLGAIDATRFHTSVVLLEDGPLVERLRAGGIDVDVLPTSKELTTVGRAEAVASPLAAASSAMRSLATVPRLARAIRAAQPDLVVANSLKSAVLVGIAAPLAGRRWVWHLHDRIAEDYLPGVMVRGLRLLARHGPRVVVVNSEATRATLGRLRGGKTVVAYPGLEVAAFDPAQREKANALFGLLGRIAPTKGQTEFLRAAALVAARLDEAQFAVIGEAMFNDAGFAERIRALPHELGIDDRMEFTGWAADPVAAIGRLTALVHASPVPEPFGQVLVEAMLAGVPVIGTNAGGVPEIIDPERVGEEISPGLIRAPLGLLARPGDPEALAAAMMWSVENPAEVDSMRLRARESAAARFDIRLSARLVESGWALAVGRPEGIDPSVREGQLTDG